jgi:hypothetical protein
VRITFEARIERSDGTWDTVEIFALERAPNPAPSCGIGLLLRESRELVGKVQGVVLRLRRSKSPSILFAPSKVCGTQQQLRCV